jgi:cold shock CspA family protein
VVNSQNPEFENSEPICGSIETVARPESPGLIRLKKHMGSGEGPTEAISYSFEEWKKQPDLADLEKGNHVKFQVSKGKNGFKAVNIQRRYSGRVKLTKESYGFVIYKENELFFHSSEASDFESFHKDDIVEFSVRYNDRSDKFNACDVSRLSKKRLSMH